MRKNNKININKINTSEDNLSELLRRSFELPKELEEILQMGAEKARRESRKRMEKVRKSIGIKPLANLKK